MINMPIVIEVIAFLCRIHCVTNMTHITTTSGFTFAIHSGRADSPTVRITYLGIVA